MSTTPANGWIVTTREAALLGSGECRPTFNPCTVGVNDAAHETQDPASSRTRYPAHVAGHGRATRGPLPGPEMNDVVKLAA